MRVRNILILCMAVTIAGCSGGNVRTAKSAKNKHKVAQPISYAPARIARLFDEKGRPAVGIRVIAVVEYQEDKPSVEIGPTAISDKDGEVFFGEFPIRSVMTNSKEMMLFRQLPRYTLVAYEPGKRLGSTYTETIDYHSPLSLFHPQYEPCKLRMSVWNLRPCRGIVVDEKGKPVSGARVSPCYPELSSTVLDKVVKLPSAITDSTGAYTLSQSPVEYGKQRVEVQKDGYVRLPEPPGVHFDHKRVVMVRSGDVTGRVVDEDGKPLVDVQILVEGGHPGRESTTDREGRFVFKGVTPGNCLIRINEGKSDLLAKPKEGVHVLSGETTDVGDIVASSGVVVSGRLVDSSTGERLGGSISADSLSYGHGHGSRINCRQGSFSLRLLPGETYRISARDFWTLFVADFDSGLDVKVPKAGIRNLDLKVKKAITGRGRVLDDRGRAICGASVSVPGFMSFNATGPLWGMSRTDAQGRFEVPLMRNGDDRAIPNKVALAVADTARRMDFVQSVDRDAFIKGNVTIRLNPTVKLRVLVEDKVTKMPVKGAYVYYRNYWLKTDTAGEAVFQMNTRVGNCPITVYKSYGLAHSRSSIMLPTSESKSWSDSVTIMMEPLRRS